MTGDVTAVKAPKCTTRAGRAVDGGSTNAPCHRQAPIVANARRGRSGCSSAASLFADPSFAHRTPLGKDVCRAALVFKRLHLPENSIRLRAFTCTSDIHVEPRVTPLLALASFASDFRIRRVSHVPTSRASPGYLAYPQVCTNGREWEGETQKVEHVHVLPSLRYPPESARPRTNYTARECAWRLHYTTTLLSDSDFYCEQRKPAWVCLLSSYVISREALGILLSAFLLFSARRRA